MNILHIPSAIITKKRYAIIDLYRPNMSPRAIYSIQLEDDPINLKELIIDIVGREIIRIPGYELSPAYYHRMNLLEFVNTPIDSESIDLILLKFISLREHRLLPGITVRLGS